MVCNLSILVRLVGGPLVLVGVCLLFRFPVSSIGYASVRLGQLCDGDLSVLFTALGTVRH